jgi:hypothetical protein
MVERPAGRSMLIRYSAQKHGAEGPQPLDPLGVERRSPAAEPGS